MALDMNNFSTDMTKKEAVYAEKKIRIGFIGTTENRVALGGDKSFAHAEGVDLCILLEQIADDVFVKRVGSDYLTFIQSRFVQLFADLL